MRGFQKGITLGGRSSGSACKVMGGVGWVGWVVLMILVSLQSRLGVRSWELGVSSLELGVWSWSGLRLDFRLTILLSGNTKKILLSLVDQNYLKIHVS